MATSSQEWIQMINETVQKIAAEPHFPSQPPRTGGHSTNDTSSGTTTDHMNDPTQSLTLSDIVEKYAPIGLEDEFQELYRLWTSSSSSATFLLGPRGSGKTFLVAQVLRAITDLHNRSNDCGCTHPPFRWVYLHGAITTPGYDVAVVLHEILQQLIAQQESSTTTSSNSGRTLQKLRQTTFTHNLQLWNEMIALASADQIPILLCMDELEAFVPVPQTSRDVSAHQAVENDTPQDRQVLLYHLLDKIANYNSSNTATSATSTSSNNIHFIGLTCHFKVMNLFEKRIKSRASSGTSKILQLRLPSTYSSLTKILLHKFQPHPALKKVMEEFLDTTTTTSFTSAEMEDLQRTLQRNHALGKDVRWFLRVITIVLAEWKAHIIEYQEAKEHSRVVTSGTEQAVVSTPPRLQLRFFQDALVDMGASFVTDIGKKDTSQLIRGRFPNETLDFIRNLPGPQMVLLFAARRMSSRSKKGAKKVGLSFHRIYDEYQRTYKGISDRYNRSVLFRAFHEMLDTGLFRPASERVGHVPLMYRLDTKFRDMDVNLLEKTPLHLTVEPSDVYALLEGNLFKCSTALHEWAKKNHAE